MDGNQWNSTQYYDYQRSQEQGNNRIAADAVQDAHRLLGVYPMASATPTMHVTRHLSNLSITTAPPTYVQPNYYNAHSSPVTHVNTTPYTHYPDEVSYLSNSHMAADDSGYWESARNDAVRYLEDEQSMYHSNNYYTPNNGGPSYWTQNASSSYQTPPFAQSIFQRMTPSSSYPTPPPPMKPSSSSLAYALGYPPSKSPTTPHKPEESKIFFNDFLTHKSKEIDTSRNVTSEIQITPKRHPVVATPQRRKEAVADHSPDPLALRSGPITLTSDAISAKSAKSSSSHAPFSLTPRKRKPSPQLGTPPPKRIHAGQSALPSSVERSFSPSTSVPTTPSESRSASRQKLAYVHVPPLPQLYFTPPSNKKKISHRVKNDSPDDLGGYGSEDEVDDRQVQGNLASAKLSTRRTGDRDDRVPLEKLIALLEDMFEAEDALPTDIDVADLPSEFFSPLTIDSTQPQLNVSMIRKLTKYISQVARPAKRLRRAAREGAAGSNGTPKGKGGLAEVDNVMLSRILKVLERSVKASEDLDPFGNASTYREQNSPRKSKKAAKVCKKPSNGELETSGTNVTTGDREEPEEETFRESSIPQELTESDLNGLTRILEVAKDGVAAAGCCIALLGSDRLAKQLYSEELITTCLSTIKNQLTRMIYPFVEASSGGPSALLLQHLLKNSSHLSSSHRRQLGELFQALSATLPLINNLICGETVVMSDAIIIQTVFIAIGPFFVVESGNDSNLKGKKENPVLSTLGNSAMRGLRLDALSLIRSIFANHEDQRSWIIEEILTSLIKLSDSNKKAGQFRLRDGRSIRTVSALLLQLVQTSAHDVRLLARKIGKNRLRSLAMRRQESSYEKVEEPLLDEYDMEEISLYISGLESATKAAKTIILFLTQRSGKGKATKTSNEAEYRTILDNLISDLLIVLYWPEWPAASLLLGIVCKFMVSSLEDVRTSNQVDTNGVKSIALDHLGVIAARIRSSHLKVKQRGNALLPLEEILASANLKEFDRLVQSQQDIAAHSYKRSSDDQAYDSARELSAATWGQDLALALKQLSHRLQDPGDDDTNMKFDVHTLRSFVTSIKNTLQDVWTEHTSDVFDTGSREEVTHIDQVAEEIGTVQSLRSSFNPILNVVLLALDAPPVFIRTKALRALGQIVTSDSSVLSISNVRRAIESHLLDSSSAVRDAAVELIGKYMIDSPEVAGEYYQRIADRIADTGLGVRKRVIKLLKSYYYVTEDMNRRIDISTKLVLRMLDEDDTVKDLAIKTLEELWFQDPSLTGLPQRVKSASGSHTVHDKGPLLSKVTVIMGVSSNFKDRQSPLEDMLHKIMVDKDGIDASSLRATYSEICEALIDGLVDASDLPGFTVISCIRTIYLFTTAYPSVLSGSNASTLLPYLKNATTPEELIMSDYLLKIFKVSVPHMPKTATKFGQELQLALQPMILKPSTVGGVQGLQETVACMCVVVQHLTHDFTRLVALMKSCNVRLQQAIRKPGNQKMTPVEIRALSILIFIVALLGEHCNFDRLRNEREDFVPDLNAVANGSIIEHIYNSLLKLYEKHDDGGLRGRILQCLGFLFRAQPTLMTMERSACIMDSIFDSPDEEGRGRLLRIMQDFLISEASKHSSEEKKNGKSQTATQDVDMGELVGNTDGFADSGVSSAVVQRYITSILDAALSPNAQLQGVAVDILSFTVKQGLAHPLQSFPIIVALETSPVVSMSTRANALHAVLHSKHMSLLNTRYVISAKESFNYQKRICTDAVQGYRLQPVPTALLQRWYSLVRDKRAPRQDFLKALVKVFEVNSALQSAQDDVDFARYMAENFSAFDYKTQEEVITVIKYLTAILSTSGMQLLEILSPSNLLAQLHEGAVLSANGGETHSHFSNGQPPAPARPLDLPLMRSSVVIGMMMLLKSYLKILYGISEEKCSKFVLGKKSAIGDRPAAKRHQNPISWVRLPFATTSLSGDEDLEKQKATFLEIWNEDGVTAEPVDEFM